MKKFILFVLSLSMYGCTYFAVTFTPKKKTIIKDIAISCNANQYFWTQFHQGKKDSIPAIIEYLSKAYFTNPNDVVTTAHLGFTHIWAYAEADKDITPGQLLTHFELAKKYFGEAYDMNPNDPRIEGFLAGTKLLMGSVSKNEKMTTEGYFQGKESIRKWPQFNKFTIGVSTAGLSTKSKYFQEGLKWQWETLDDCFCEKTDRSKQDYSPYVKATFENKDPKIKRACANTWIAPHNWEGFFMNFGDMLVKNGEWQKGIKMYESAKLAPSFAEWKFKDELESRIKEAELNVPLFQTKKKTMSAGQCKYCHLKSADEIKLQGTEIPDKSYYFLGTGKLYPSCK
jgi:hypothetical protein